MHLISKDIEQYCKDHSLADSDLLMELSKSTWDTEDKPQMLCGSLVGGLLQMLIKISGAKKVLDRSIARRWGGSFLRINEKTCCYSQGLV